MTEIGKLTSLNNENLKGKELLQKLDREVKSKTENIIARNNLRRFALSIIFLFVILISIKVGTEYIIKLFGSETKALVTFSKEYIHHQDTGYDYTLVHYHILEYQYLVKGETYNIRKEIRNADWSEYFHTPVNLGDSISIKYLQNFERNNAIIKHQVGGIHDGKFPN